MNWIPVILALGVLGVMGLVFGIMLSVADKKLHVETDPRIGQVKDCLGGANCGACGYAGCDALAEAIVAGEAKPNACPAGNLEFIGQILGISLEKGEKKIARVICMGSNGIAKERYEYDGYASCATAAGIAGGPKMCRFACLGLGDCVKVCEFGAITLENGLAVIDPDRCKACGQCIEACPRHAIRLVSASETVSVLCRNEDVGRTAVNACLKACIACGRCKKECQYDAITIENGFAKIDPEKCTRCGACAKVCPRNCIEDFAVEGE